MILILSITADEEKGIIPICLFYLADEINIAPGIVVGRLQHEGILLFNINTTAQSEILLGWQRKIMVQKNSTQ